MARGSAKAKQPPASTPTTLDTGRMESVAFGQLAVSPLNVRKDAEVGPDDELVASIRAHGLLQPLVGYIATSGLAIVLICAGQRRLLALQHIASAETPIPVRIVDEATAIEVSLAENLARKDMNPADELAAFQALVDTGAYDGNRIADRFGYDRRYVRRRLKMAVLAPEIMDALRDGTIGISSAEAYAASDDRELQLKVFKGQVQPNVYNPHSPGKILQEYSWAGLSAESGVGKFIGGVEAYEAAGGSCARDEAFIELFDTHGAPDGPRLTDHKLVGQLLERAQASAQEAVEKLAKDQVPYASAVEWCDAKGNAPKPPKGSDLVLLSQGWDGAAGEYRDAARVRKLAKAIADAGGEVRAIAEVNRDGVAELVEDAFLVGKAAFEAARPKAKENEHGAAGMTTEEREAHNRSLRVQACAANLYGRQLVGNTPGYVVTRCYLDWRGNIEIELLSTGEAVTREAFEAAVQPFMDAAEKQVAAGDEARAAAIAGGQGEDEEDADVDEEADAVA
jgi:ParB/RepB/Spo0J family partition protein